MINTSTAQQREDKNTLERRCLSSEKSFKAKHKNLENSELWAEIALGCFLNFTFRCNRVFSSLNQI
ncbi:hypothetical protein AWQ22_11055 [Picosynechococcus sp. PCC 7117]|nr:hypothetical protein AWQ22_11055 [Picosynechococcus sp. PCC 7117]